MKYASAIGFLLAISTLAAMAMASPHEIVGDGWTHTWAGAGFDQGYSLALSRDSGLYVTGYTDSFGAGLSDVLLLKYDASGDLLWQRTWGGAKSDYGHAVAVDRDESIYVAGQSHSFGEGGCDVILLKYGEDGSLLWQRTWGGSHWDDANDLAIDGAGDIYVTGNIENFDGGENPLILLKYDSNGSLLWRKAWVLGYYNEGNALAFDGEGNFFVTGCAVKFGDSFTDVVLLKYDAQGNLLWQREWGGDRHDVGCDLVVDANSNLYVAGYTSSFGAGEVDSLLLKYDESGNLLWARTWGGFSDERSMGLALDDGGNVLVTGSSPSFGDGMDSVFLLRYNADGDLLQQRAWVGTAYGGGSALMLDGHGNVFICGSAFNRDASWRDVVGREFSPAGRVSFPRGTETIPTEVQTTPDGTDSEPEGLLDEKGGDLDVLVMKVNLSELLAATES